MNEKYRVLQSILFLGMGTAIGSTFEIFKELFYWGSFGYVDIPADFSLIWVVTLALGAIHLEILMKDKEMIDRLQDIKEQSDEGDN